MKKGKKLKVLALLLALVMVAVSFAACGDADRGNNQGDAAPEAGAAGDEAAGDEAAVEEGAETPEEPEPPLEGIDEPEEGFYVDANGNIRFYETRHISVGIWNRVAEIESHETYWADWIREQMLEVHNVQVEVVPIPRWPEDEFQSTLLSAGEAPDIGVSFNIGMINTMAQMGGIVNLAPYLREYREFLPNMFDQVTETNVFWNYNPNTDELWNIAGRRATEGLQNSNTFIRQDWLEALDLPVPNSREEFADTLRAFRDRASELPGVGQEVRIYVPSEEEGEDGTYRVTILREEDIVPYLLGQDTGWGIKGLVESFIPDDITEREYFVRNFDARSFMHEDATREALRVANQWFNEGLIWQDFVISTNEDGSDLIRLGKVGVFTGNWDSPYRAHTGYTRIMRENIGEDATWIPINPFENNAGNHVMYASPPVDRFVFFSIDNTEIFASLLYLDFMTRPVTLNFLQFGIEGVHHYINEDGIRAMLPIDDIPTNMLMSGPRNFDITLLMNGLWSDLIDRENALAHAALAYPGVAPELVMKSFNMTVDASRVWQNVTHRHINAEDGMDLPLRDMRDQIYHRLIANTDPANFDAEFDREYSAYLQMGAAAIMAERDEAWVEAFGDVDFQPPRED